MKSIDLEKQIFASDKPEKIRFIEGPPTMNGIPHAGHLEEESSKICGTDTIHFKGKN